VIFYPTPTAIIVKKVEQRPQLLQCHAAFEPQLRQRTAALRNTNERNMDRLELLISGPDPNLFRIVRAALEDPGIAGCHFSTDPAQAIEVLARRHFDGIILDCEVIASAQEVLSKIRKGPSNRQSPVVALLNGPAALPAIQHYAAVFPVFKPVSAAKIMKQLTKALDAIQEENRRYFRFAVTLPLLLSTGENTLPAERTNAERIKADLINAEVINLSSEGMAVRLSRSIRPVGMLNLTFDLPSIDPYRIEAVGEVVWTDAQGRMGIKLCHMPLEARHRYTAWLDVLYAQNELRRLNEEALANL
jgi:CheY-like chemotaxis protein